MSRSYKIPDKEGVYFLSLATVGWVDVFSRKNYREIVVDSLRYCQEKKGLLIHSWCIMSNHIHLIASAKDKNLPDIIRDFKKHTAKTIISSIENADDESRKEWMLHLFRSAGGANSNNKTYQFWRQDNRPIELFSNGVIDQKLDYIHNNPVEAGLVEAPEDWLYSSAKDYAGGSGLLQVTFLD